MTNLFRSWLTMTSVFCGACGVMTDDAITEELVEPAGAVGSRPTLLDDEKGPDTVELPTLVTDRCDDATHAGETWASAQSTHFTARFFAGTAADNDQAALLATRETAYEQIRQALGVTAEPALSLYLSPNRLAALANNRGMGTAYPADGRLEVIYSGAADSYENTRFGHELTHLIEPYIDPANPRRHPFLSEGLAEYLDQSGRDMHHAYAQQLIAGYESRVRVAQLESGDVWARNYGRAGSFVQFLVERYGMDDFLTVFRATAVNWVGGCWTHARYGCINTPEKLQSMLDGALGKVNESWAIVQPAWEARMQEALVEAPTALTAADLRELETLLAVMDRATASGNAELYRSALDGFYCDANAEQLRTDIAQRAVAAFAHTSSKLEMAYDTGVTNFRTAQILVRRTDARDLPTFTTWSVEHFPVGWRVTYSPDWY